jgi:PAS domain S-box-containing protein
MIFAPVGTIGRAPTYEERTSCIAGGRRLLMEEAQTRGGVVDDSARAPLRTATSGGTGSIEGLQDVLARIGTALYVVDAETEEYVTLSPMFTTLLGYTLDDVAAHGGRRLFLQHLIVSDDVEEKTHGFSRIQDGQATASIREHRIWCRHKDGALRYMEDHWIPEYADGRLVRTYGILRDVTAQKETEDALVETEGTYRTLFDSLADPIVIFEKQTNRILDCNRAMVMRFGYSVDELRTKTPLDLVAPGETKAAAEKNIDDEDDTSAHEYIMVAKDGGEIPVETLTADVRYHARDAWITIVRDITERREAAERAKRYTAEIEAANEEIKQFAYIVSHDLRAPLVNLRGFSAELRRALDGVLPLARQALTALPAADQRVAHDSIEEDIPEALGFIDSSVTRMDSFINAVLKLSRIGRRELVYLPLDPRPLVEEILRTLAHQQAAHDATVTVADLPQVTADRTALEQIFGNLLANALLYLVPGRPGRIDVGGTRGKTETTFWVRDNGRGIAAEDADKIFAPFRRAGKQDVPGEGMGLSYVHTMVRQHGGLIWFESTPDVGTTFFFTLSSSLGDQGGSHAERP